MSFLRHQQIYHPMDLATGAAALRAAPGLIVSMSLRPAIPWRVALLQCSPPLHRLLSMLKEVAVGVNHHLMEGVGNFQPAEWGIFNRP